MANRAYLYSINDIPGTKVEQHLIPKGLSEWEWEVPLLFSILLGDKPKICDSIIGDYEEKVSLAGNYAEGLANLKQFATLMDQPNLSHREQFMRYMDESIRFLSDPTNAQTYTLLELGELYEMDATNQVETTQIRVEMIAEAIHKNDIQFLNRNFGEGNKDILAQWDDSLGFGNWSNILYFDFDPYEYKTPFTIKEPVVSTQSAEGLSPLAAAILKSKQQNRA